MQSVNLTDHFLIAMPAMTDPYFPAPSSISANTTNRAPRRDRQPPARHDAGGPFERIEVPLNRRRFRPHARLFRRPGTDDRGFVLHQPVGGWQSTLAVNDHIGLTSSRDILQSVGAQGIRARSSSRLGYAGWSAGQLEDEISQNAWLTVPATPHPLRPALRGTPARRHERARHQLR